jgi:hypothetical protein
MATKNAELEQTLATVTAKVHHITIAFVLSQRG